MAASAEIVGFREECWEGDDENTPLTRPCSGREEAKEDEEAKEATEVNGAEEAHGPKPRVLPWMRHTRVAASMMTLSTLGLFVAMCLNLMPTLGLATTESTTITTTTTTTTTTILLPRDPKCTLHFEDHNFRFNKTLRRCVDTRCKKPNHRYSSYMKVCMDKNEVGRTDKLYDMLKDHGLKYSALTWGIWPMGTPLLDREGILWHMALAEEHLDAQKISGWGRNAPKFPRSWLPKLQALNHTKRYRYNFQGGGMNHYPEHYEHRRKFMIRFAKTHFDARDFLRWTDILGLNETVDDAGHYYRPLGAYDYSGAALPGGFILRKSTARLAEIYFDDFYFGSMAASNFTVAPGGDGPCTLRFYEAVAARSIPLVPAEDAPLVGCHCPYAYIPYTFATDKNLLEHSEAIVEDNFRLFVKYQTFTQGDHVPPFAPGKFAR